MSVPRPRTERPDDLGDVLAEIRRLVARGGDAPQPDAAAMVVTARVVAGSGDERQPGAPQSLALSVELPMANAGHAARQGGGPASAAPPAGTDHVPAGEPGDAAGRAAWMGGPTGGRLLAPQEAPFRLNPDAMIPPPTGRLRLTPGPGVMDRPGDAGAAEDLSACAGPDLIGLGEHLGPHRTGEPQPGKERSRGDIAATVPQPPIPAAVDDRSAAPGGHSGAPPGPLGGPVAGNEVNSTPTPDQPTAIPPRASAPLPTYSFNKEPDMQAHANSPVSPVQANTAMHFVPERPVSAADTLQGDEENPLRALLREVVREEFEGELKRSLDDNLRRMVRSEIAAALTEALVRRPRD